MKDVLISIQPKWCDHITLGKKTVEVRKTKPKIKTPFKCYIYCTEKDYDKVFCIDKFMHKVFLNGKGKQKVIGEFVCDRIDELQDFELSPSKRFYEVEKSRLDLFLKESCLSYDEICEYRKNLPYFKPLYGWHISNLKIYDKPKELSEFKRPCNKEHDCCVCDRYDYMGHKCFDEITRPPQSWGYVEEL